jgi:hypothetical protein
VRAGTGDRIVDADFAVLAATLNGPIGAPVRLSIDRGGIPQPVAFELQPFL